MSVRPPSKTEAAYKELSRVGAGSMTDEAVGEIRRALGHPAGLLCARAAQIAGKRGLSDLIPDMLIAFDRLMADGAKRDKGCQAKAAIAQALNHLEHLDDSVFQKGAYYRQMEPAFGEFVDTAIELRCQCAFGLARIGRSDAHYALAELLVDPESAVRAAAAKALGAMASLESEIMLRMKVLTGDAELEVLGECFTSLIAMAPDRSLEFVARSLRSSDPALAEYAALAIGQSHADGAFETLHSCWEGDPSPSLRRVLLLPMALVRSDEAFGFLLETVRRADSRTAAEAVAALALYSDGASVTKIRDVVAQRDDRAVTASFERGVAGAM